MNRTFRMTTALVTSLSITLQGLPAWSEGATALCADGSAQPCAPGVEPAAPEATAPAADPAAAPAPAAEPAPVSYTHLTLPTKRIV